MKNDENGFGDLFRKTMKTDSVQTVQNVQGF